jgi:dienelactone hydrolase
MKIPRQIAILLASSVLGLAQTPTAPSPPPGIEIPEQDRRDLSVELSQLRADFDKFAASGSLSPNLSARLPDVEIFPIAVSRALEWGEFYDLKQVAAAKKLLQEGRARLDALKAGDAPWTRARGLVVRGFRSRIDASVQPYGIVVPEEPPAAPSRLDVWLHGRNDKLTELAFLTERMKSRGEFAPAGTHVLHPYGRLCNGFKFAGETDVLEAVADAQTQYGTSPSHVAIRGFSMGGAGCWHLAAHYTSKWAVANPGAGFVETAQYAKVFAPGKPVPPWWEQVLWRLYDVPGYVTNLKNRPVVAYSGEIDPQKQAADLMVEAAAAEGFTFPHLIGPGTGHKFHPETKLEVAAKVDAAAARGCPPAPENVNLTTFTLRYNRMDWVEITGLHKHWEASSVNASRTAPGEITVSTKGVTSLSLTPPAGWNPKGSWKLTCDGQTLSATAAPAVHLQKRAGKWEVAPAPPGGGGKRHGLQGPIDDAFQEAFVFVRPTGKSLHPATEAWVHSEMERALAQWKRVFRGEITVVDDNKVTPDLMAAHHLVLWGDPGSNLLLAKLTGGEKGRPESGKLPVLWNEKELKLGKASYAPAHHVPVLVYPNPLSPSRYIVINSTFTFRQGSDTTNALQTPKLPDWAVVDLRTPPSKLAPGEVVDAGFFDEAWQLP